MKGRGVWVFVTLAVVGGMMVGYGVSHFSQQTALAHPPEMGFMGERDLGAPGRPPVGPGAMPPQMPFPHTPPSAMVAVGDSLFILLGHTLFQYEAKTLKLVRTTELPLPQIPPHEEPGSGPPPKREFPPR
ncbi:MAG: hypothetical protein V2G48_06335 [bacterium JZ-2024 1]